MTSILKLLIPAVQDMLIKNPKKDATQIISELDKEHSEMKDIFYNSSSLFYEHYNRDYWENFVNKLLDFDEHVQKKNTEREPDN